MKSSLFLAYFYIHFDMGLNKLIFILFIGVRVAIQAAPRIAMTLFGRKNFQHLQGLR